MYQPTNDDRADGALVIRGNQATLFGPVGTPVPPDARMGVAEARAAALMARPAATRPTPTPSRAGAPAMGTLRFAGAPVR
jgi:hypothetical protein